MPVVFKQGSRVAGRVSSCHADQGLAMAVAAARIMGGSP
jgi:hypothetical protein